MDEEGPKLFVDTREPLEIVELLAERGLPVEIKQLTIGDYVIDNKTAIERKSAADFVKSLFDGRLLEQAKRLKSVYQTALLVVEGDFTSAIAWRRNPRAYWGALVAIALDDGLVPLFTSSMKDTAELITVISHRVWENHEGKYEIRQKPKILSTKERQIYVVEGLPGIGKELAERLLKYFGSVRSVMKASEGELTQIDGIGKGKASIISQLLDAEFDGAENMQSKLLQ
ncbi:MAG: ERCC4 domain-containing protein [Thermoprotei archaeon]